jgi:hypothetical protein
MSSPSQQQPNMSPDPWQGQRPTPAQPLPALDLPQQPYGQMPPPVPKQRNGLAITAIVMAGVALLLGLGQFVFSMVIGAMFGGFASSAGPFGAPGMEGTAPQVVAGQVYPGRLLQDEVARVVGDSGSGGPSFSCPATSAVVARAVTICHEAGGGPGSTVKVTFEDDLGHFTMEWN